MLTVCRLRRQTDSLEVEVFEGEVDLDDSGRLDSRPQDVLLCRLVVFGTEPLQIVKEAAMEQEKGGDWPEDLGIFARLLNIERRLCHQKKM